MANNIKGTMALPHPYGRLQFGADLDLHFRTLIGTGCNPNVAAVVVICIEPGMGEEGGRRHRRHRQAGRLVRHRAARRPRHHLRASKKAKEFVQWASELTREERPLERPVGLHQVRRVRHHVRLRGQSRRSATPSTSSTAHGTRCCFGETTELTGGEHLVAARCRTDEVRKKFQFMFDRYQALVERHKTSDLSDSQPTKGNIEGGLTTIEEKALGNIQKIGRKCLVDGVLDKAETPTGPGLWFMDSSSAAAEMVTLCAAAGFAVHFFPTGQGNVIGNPILPVIKLCANPRTVRTMSEHIDVDVSGLLRREMTLDQAGDALLECMIRTANGRLTAAEALGHREFVLTRLYESA